MDLTKPSQENVEYMIEAIKNKLKMVSAAAMQASAFSVDHYEDIYDVYEVAMGSDRLSISQVEALVSELGSVYVINNSSPYTRRNDVAVL